jgi:hypothetical protein
MAEFGGGSTGQLLPAGTALVAKALAFEHEGLDQAPRTRGTGSIVNCLTSKTAQRDIEIARLQHVIGES